MTLKIGLIGCGGISRAHVEGWKTVVDRAEIVAVADISGEAAEERAAQIGHQVKIYADYNDLLEDEEIDAVDIMLPHHLHHDAIVATAEAGKDLMVEKPLCLSLDEAAGIAQAVKGSGIIMMAAHNQLFFPSVLQAKQMIVKGDLGEIYMVNSVDCGAHRRPLNLDKSGWSKSASHPAATGWRSDPAKMGGGELIDTGYHPTYRLLFLAGQKPVEVSALLGTYRLPLKREDTANVLVGFEKGMTGKIFSSWAMRAPGARPTLFNVMGEAGQLWGEIDKLYFQPVGFQTPAVVEYPGWDYGRSFAAEITHFVDAIEGGFEPLYSVAEATKTLRVILAAYQSIEEGIIVKL
ncbi:MAG: Gfo/Idh/MocA family oxidoreductase [Chloroflexota bacterium]|nr:Gfo/Idh/MocA family oxidoreductase [Chloroflexota bacterium]